MVSISWFPAMLVQKESRLWAVENGMQPCIVYDIRMVVYKAVESGKKIANPTTSEKGFFPWTRRSSPDQQCLYCGRSGDGQGDKTDRALRYLKAIFNLLRSMLKKCPLHFFKEKELEQCRRVTKCNEGRALFTWNFRRSSHSSQTCWEGQVC